MVKLSSFELKTYFTKQPFVGLLNWNLAFPEPVTDVGVLLLNLGGEEIIGATIQSAYFCDNMDGYTVLHMCLAHGSSGDGIRVLLTKRPDLHQLGFDGTYTPQEESPTSLAMYSSWAFAFWVRELESTGQDRGQFVDEELRRNSRVQAGWAKETMLDLFASEYHPDLHFRQDFDCSDCLGEAAPVRVQPYWRHFLEKIKQRTERDISTQVELAVTDEEKNADVANRVELSHGPSNQHDKPKISENTHVDDLDNYTSDSEWESASSSGSVWDDDIQSYPKNISLLLDCLYARDEVICIACWEHYVLHWHPKYALPGRGFKCG